MQQRAIRTGEESGSLRLDPLGEATDVGLFYPRRLRRPVGETCIRENLERRGSVSTNCCEVLLQDFYHSHQA